VKPRLSDIQDQLGRYLLADNQPLPQGLAGSAKDLKRRLSVYRNNVFHSLTQALVDLYPLVQRLVGDEFFHATARRYLQEFPPNQAAMVHFGKDFPGFLQRDEIHAGLGYLADRCALSGAGIRAKTGGRPAVGQPPCSPPQRAPGGFELGDLCDLAGASI